MRRVTLTLFLAATACAAVLIAPRLVGSAPVELPSPTTELPVVSLPVVVEPPVVVERVLPVERLVRRVITPVPVSDPVPDRPTELIPELQVPIAPNGPPNEPVKPIPEDFWPDMVDCGMG